MEPPQDGVKLGERITTQLFQELQSSELVLPMVLMDEFSNFIH